VLVKIKLFLKHVPPKRRHQCTGLNFVATWKTAVSSERHVQSTLAYAVPASFASTLCKYKRVCVLCRCCCQQSFVRRIKLMFHVGYYNIFPINNSLAPSCDILFSTSLFSMTCVSGVQWVFLLSVSFKTEMVDRLCLSSHIFYFGTH
jgi:hypothetical protein